MSESTADPGPLRLAGSRILFLNWRCPWHPQAGGAEQYCWKIARCFVEAGAEVTYVTARPAGLAADEVREGIRIHRRGGRFTVYMWAALFVLLRGWRYQAVIDSQNGIPFFSPLFLASERTAVILVVHHVHQDQFDLVFRWPLNAVGKLLEGPVSRWAYTGRTIVAVSPTTREGMRRRLHLKGPISVVPNGIEHPPTADLPARSAEPQVIYLGRLVPHKRVHLLLGAAASIRGRWPGLRVHIVGRGPEAESLRAEAGRLALDDIAQFTDWVSDEDRSRLLASSWLLSVPSIWEGWGVTVIEANAHGRPAIAFRVPGLVNSVVHGLNGWLVDGEEDLASALDAHLSELSDPARAEEFAERCRRWARPFTWWRSAQRMSELIAEASGPAAAALPHGSSDTATVVRLRGATGLEALSSLVPSDLWEVHGDTVEVLLQGLDEEGAVAALEELGLSGWAEVRVANESDRLLGIGVG